jgi:endo-1,4-beta-xylanase
MRCGIFLSLLVAGAGLIVARAQTNLLPGGLRASDLSPQGQPNVATASAFSVSGQPFTTAVRARTVSTPANPWSIQLNRILAGISLTAGDVVAGEIWFRNAGTNGQFAVVEGIFERSGGDYTKSFTRLWTVADTNWVRRPFAFRVAETYSGAATNRAQFNLRLGFGPQLIEIAGLSLTNFRRTQSLTNFPNDITYIGREPNAPWRAAAAARIAQHRQAGLTVEVRDQDGFPVPGAIVNVRQTRHEFGFGSAVNGARLTGAEGTASDLAHYQRIITNWFNTVVLENDLKWPPFENTTPPNRRSATNSLNWFQARGIPCRGHNLIWPGLSQSYFLPDRVRTAMAASNTNLVRSYINQHFTNILTLLRGRLSEWDVMNEIIHERDVQRLLGDAEMLHWFRLARNLDPTAKLYVNEYENLEVAGLPSTAPQRLYDVVRYFITNGAPVDGIGLQSHFGSYLPDPALVYDQIDWYAGLGLDLQITEFDIDITEEQAQADYTRDFMTAVFSHPRVNALLSWGFWERQHWRPDAAWFRADWSMKPAGIMWSNLVLREWWTTTNAVTDTNGRVQLRGFKGRYEIQTVAAGTTNRMTVNLDTNRVVTAGVTIPLPAIQITPREQGFRLRWPTVPAGFVLESTETLNAAAWRSAGREAVLVDGVLQLDITPRTAQRFFRLRRTN